MESSKDKIVSIAGTAVFHLVLILGLLFYYLSPSTDKRWSEPLEGVPVMFGNVPDAFGDDEPFGRGNGGQAQEDLTAEVVPPTPSQSQAQTTPSVTPPAKTASATKTETSVATQDFEETVSIKEAAKKKEETEKKKQQAIVAEQKRREQAEADRIAAAETKKKQDINNQMAGLFGNGTGSGSRGNTSGEGTQGVPTGNASYGKTSGIGGWGSYDLGGRSVGRGGLAKPSYTEDDYGTVVVDIIVDPQGNVTEATFGKGTNVTSATLKNEALKAARRTKFSTTTKPGNQKGTITYKFNLN